MTNKQRGNALGFWFFRTSMKLFGLSGTYGLLYFVCLYYALFDNRAVSSSMAYIKRRFSDYGVLRTRYSVYKLFISQGKNLIDRFYAVSGLGKFDIELRGYDRIKSLLGDSPKGLILLTAHVGNWQVTMTALEKLGKKVYLLMSPEENRAVKDSLNIDGSNEMIKVISPDTELGGVIEIMKAIDEGSIVSIMGDRSYGHSTVEVNLLGEKAWLPYSAFSIAASARCPLAVLLSAKVETKKYFVDVSHVMEPRTSSRKKRKEEIRGYVQNYADILDQYSSEYPFQWFVFHDIWMKEKGTPSN